MRKRPRYTPVTVAWELTLACNMKCMHCGSSAGQTRQKELTTKEALILCDQLQNLKTKMVGLTGGEPLLRKDWFEIGMKIRDLGMDLSILSNGLLINEKTIALFRKLDMYTVGISFDGGHPQIHDTIRGIPGSFEQCLSSMQMLKDAGLPVSVITTIHKNNLKDLPQIRELIKDKARAWQIQIAVPIGRFSPDLLLSKEEFYSLALFIAATRKQFSMKKFAVIGAHSIGYHSKILRNTMASPVWNGCQAGITVLGIQSNGDIKGCLSLPDTFIKGNLRDTPIDEIWNHPNAFPENRKFQPQELKNHCKGCKYGKTCKGGCLTASTSVAGETHCDPYCLHHIEKELFQ